MQYVSVTGRKEADGMWSRSKDIPLLGNETDPQCPATKTHHV